MRRGAAAAVAVMMTMAACGGRGSSKKAASAATTPTTPATTSGPSATAAPTASSAPSTTASGQPAVDDFDGDGQPDSICSTQDFGGGLVLRVPCQIATASDPPQGVTLVPDSLFRLPGPTDLDLDGISGSAIVSRHVDGTRVVIITSNSDALFASGSDQINSTDTLDNIVKLINGHFPGSTIQVRGHTDSTGTAAANQSLSERRAANVKNFLSSHGTKAASFSSVGFGSTRPLAKETNPDGSANADAQTFDRRVEIVLRVP